MYREHTHTYKQCTEHTSKSFCTAVWQRCLQHQEWNAFVRTIYPTHQLQVYHGRFDWIRPCVTLDLLLTWCDSCCLFGILFAVEETEDTIRSFSSQDSVRILMFFLFKEFSIMCTWCSSGPFPWVSSSSYDADAANEQQWIYMRILYVKWSLHTAYYCFCQCLNM